MHQYPPPNLQELLPPVLACLPTAFFSPHPPPAFLPLLSPILRQRINLLASSASESAPSSTSNTRPTWLTLLSWSRARGARLNDVVSELNLEPHPVSGELELFEDETGDPAGKVKYRQLDPETFQAKCDVHKYNISVVWVWCTNDTGGVGLENASSGKGEDGWRVAEVRACGTEDGNEADSEADEQWFTTQAEAEAAAKETLDTDELEQMTQDGPQRNEFYRRASTMTEDDDYWASYDRTPARTPSKHSPGPGMMTAIKPPLGRRESAEERAYFARYGNEVQPAMDSSDPDGELESQGIESSLGQPSHQQNGRSRGFPHANIPEEAEENPQAYEQTPTQPQPPPLGLGTSTTAALNITTQNLNIHPTTSLHTNPTNPTEQTPTTAILPQPPNTAIEPPAYLREALDRQYKSSFPTTQLSPSTRLRTNTEALSPPPQEALGPPPTYSTDTHPQYGYLSSSEEVQNLHRSLLNEKIHSPIPSRPLSQHSSHSANEVEDLNLDAGGKRQSPPVEILERAAVRMSISNPAAEVGVKQHISTEMKSLYRLARAVGMDREEFERCIRREIEVLGMLDEM